MAAYMVNGFDLYNIYSLSCYLGHSMAYGSTSNQSTQIIVLIKKIQKWKI